MTPDFWASEDAVVWVGFDELPLQVLPDDGKGILAIIHDEFRYAVAEDNDRRFVLAEMADQLIAARIAASRWRRAAQHTGEQP